jgi:hypothetical protein
MSSTCVFQIKWKNLKNQNGDLLSPIEVDYSSCKLHGHDLMKESKIIMKGRLFRNRTVNAKEIWNLSSASE